MDVTVPLQDTITCQDSSDYFIDHIVEYMCDDLYHWVKVHWLGFSHEKDSWEPLHQIFADAPKSIHEFLASCSQAHRLAISAALGI